MFHFAVVVFFYFVIKVYYDKASDDSAGWILIARFSNNDDKNWMNYDGSWWYDASVGIGNIIDPTINADMISPSFWLISGRGFKITRSDDPLHTPLLQTTGDCLDELPFRYKLTSFGDFRNGVVWGYNKCLGSCSVEYGGQYLTTDGFQQAECNGHLQSAKKVGFWCDWSDGDGSVMMIGGGGESCSRADHGIGITEENDASFGGSDKFDFGFDAQNTTYGMSTSYSLNLWIR